MTQETFAEMARRHRDADMLVAKRFEMVDGQACSIGCFCHDYGLEPSDFSGLAEITKYPEAAHHLQEAIFEGLPEAERANWHVAFAEKAATVTDWQMVIDKTVLASLRIAEPHDTSACKVVATVIALYERKLTGDNPSEAEWAAGASRAAAGAAEAAWAARGCVGCSGCCGGCVGCVGCGGCFAGCCGGCGGCGCFAGCGGCFAGCCMGANP